MAVLSIFAGAIPPDGLWSWLILNVFSFVANYGWRMVLFTLCLKLVLSPIDIYQRYKARKNQLIALKLKPQMDKLQKIYGNDQQLLARKQMELNKQAGMSYFSSCLPSIVTLIIFITLFAGGLNPISQYQNFHDYELLNAKYHEFYTDEAREQAYEKVKSEKWTTVYADVTAKTEEIRAEQIKIMKEAAGKAAYDTAISNGLDKKLAEKARQDAIAAWKEEEHLDEITVAVAKSINDRTEATIRAESDGSVKKIAQQEVFEYYESDVRTGFLWIKNIWNADVPWVAPVSDYSTFKRNIGDYGVYSKGKTGCESAEQLATMLAEYNDVMGALLNDPEYNKTNGFMIMPLLTILLSVVMQIMSFRQQKQSGQMNAQSESSSKLMMFIMPIMMAWFSFSYTSAFSIYLVMNYVVSLVIMLAGNIIVGITDKKLEYKLANEIQRYGRPDFSDQKDDNNKKK